LLVDIHSDAEPADFLQFQARQLHIGLDHVTLYSRRDGCRPVGVAPGGMCVDEMKGHAETVRLNDGRDVNVVSHGNLDAFGGGYQLADVLAGNGVRTALLQPRNTAGHRPNGRDLRIAVLGQRLRLLGKAVSDLQPLLEQHGPDGAFQDGDLARADTGERAVIGADGGRLNLAHLRLAVTRIAP
jgi:hypothetical protein